MSRKFLPILTWLPQYSRSLFASDLVAALVVTLMLIPQSLAYALLAGLPAEMGLYASILPMIIYALFGTSPTLSVGPVALIALMTASATSAVALPGTSEYIAAAMALALISGLMLMAMGLLRLGFFANFLSHPVISGFTSASAIIIAASQLTTILGVEASGVDLPELLASIVQNLETLHLPTLLLGLSALALLFGTRRYLPPLLTRAGIPPQRAGLLTKASPVLVVALTALVTWFWELEARGVAVVGAVPGGLPDLGLPPFDPSLWQALLVPALMIAIVGFVESVSVAQTLASKRRQRIDPDQELIGLGSANLASAFSGGMPVTGSFSRSVVHFDAGAATPAVGAFAALGIGLATVYLTPLISYLPKASLAATILVAVVSLVDLKAPARYWSYSKKDFTALAATLVTTLTLGVEFGIAFGVLLSLALFLYQASRPHSAVVGLVEGTEHFRNQERHQVITDPRILLFRVDEGLFFGNCRFLEDRIQQLVSQNPQVTDLVLICSAVNHIDGSALESLETINERLKDAGVVLHLSEVKGPVMDRLRDTHFLRELGGQVFLTTHAAWRQLRAEPGNGFPG